MQGACTIIAAFSTCVPCFFQIFISQCFHKHLDTLKALRKVLFNVFNNLVFILFYKHNKDNEMLSDEHRMGRTCWLSLWTQLCDLAQIISSLWLCFYICTMMRLAYISVLKMWIRYCTQWGTTDILSGIILH